MIQKKNLYFILLLACITFNYAQVAEVSPPDFIKTINLKSSLTQGQLPIIKLGETFGLEFDALNGNEDDFYYVIEHFNYDWTPSVLSKGEYLRGIDNQRIQNYENSFNTYQIYSHYQLTIPNSQTRALLKSGNYMISIYDDDDELMFSRKFMVFEDLVNVGVNIKRSRDVSLIETKQSVDVIVSSNGFNFINSLETVKTLIVQNNNLNTAITGLKPQYTLGNQLIYRYVKETSFWAGNEYLFFETKDVRASNLAIQYTDLTDIYQTYLYIDAPRKNKTYTYNPDINGNFLVTAINTSDVRTEADYT